MRRIFALNLSTFSCTSLRVSLVVICAQPFSFFKRSTDLVLSFFSLRPGLLQLVWCYLPPWGHDHFLCTPLPFLLLTVALIPLAALCLPAACQQWEALLLKWKLLPYDCCFTCVSPKTMKKKKQILSDFGQSPLRY